jgi:hypothetical protein
LNWLQGLDNCFSQLGFQFGVTDGAVLVLLIEPGDGLIVGKKMQQLK